MKIEFKKLSSNEIKEIELNILVEFDKLCKKNNLYYTLCGGTLLGAVRHKGFIPWDDDIDVLMPREDYERLLNDFNVDKTDLPKYMELANWKKGNMSFPFMKLVDKRTKIDSQYLDDNKSNKLWIDIFPIDGNPEDEKKLNYLYRKSLFLRRILLIKMATVGEGKTKAKKIFKPFLKLLFLPISNKYLCKKIDENARKYSFNDTAFIGGVLWGYGTCEKINKEKYMSPKKMEFEGKMFNIPSNYDEYLSNLYGEYMKLPPEEKRITHDMVAYKMIRK